MPEQEHSDQEIEQREEELKSLEAQQMRQFLDENAFDHDSHYSGTNFTPMEHHLIGSTSCGSGYHPNMPLAVLDGRTLEQTNRIREKANAERSLFTTVKLPERPRVQVSFKLLPLSQEQVAAGDFSQTVEFTESRGFLSGEPLELTPEILEQVNAELDRFRQEERRRLFKLLNQKEN